MTHGVHQACTGNGALLVLIDSNGVHWDRLIVDETILAALRHFGMPYRVLDLASQRPDAHTLADCAGIVLAQSRITRFLSSVATMPSAANHASTGPKVAAKREA